MEFIRKSDVIQWVDGEYKNISENSVEDEYTYLFIDYLPPRKFSTYPKDLEDFAVGYCLGEGLIKDYSDIESIKVDGTNILVTTVLNHDPEEDLEQEGIVQERKGNCEHACVCRLLEYQGVNSDNAGGIRSELKSIEEITSDLKINATQIIKDIKHLTDEAKIWQKTAGVHVAQLKYGDEIIIREDVSRHVAVDKVIGKAAIEGYDFSGCYISYSGRMPADMLIKVIRVGIPIIISNAAPASSGIDVAEAGNITMVGFVRDNRFTVFTAPERIDLEK
jgi:FdhD protein/cysteine desulfurase